MYRAYCTMHIKVSRLLGALKNPSPSGPGCGCFPVEGADLLGVVAQELHEVVDPDHTIEGEITLRAFGAPEADELGDIL